LTIAFGIPAFSEYGKKVEFNQKIGEVKELISQVRLLAKNPSKDGNFYQVSHIPESGFVLESCQDFINKVCTDRKKIREVKFNEFESVPPNYATLAYICPANLSQGCSYYYTGSDIINDPILTFQNAEFQKIVRFLLKNDGSVIEEITNL